MNIDSNADRPPAGDKTDPPPAAKETRVGSDVAREMLSLLTSITVSWESGMAKRVKVLPPVSKPVKVKSGGGRVGDRARLAEVLRKN